MFHWLMISIFQVWCCIERTETANNPLNDLLFSGNPLWGFPFSSWKVHTSYSEKCNQHWTSLNSILLFLWSYHYIFLEGIKRCYTFEMVFGNWTLFLEILSTLNFVKAISYKLCLSLPNTDNFISSWKFSLYFAIHFVHIYF